MVDRTRQGKTNILFPGTFVWVMFVTFSLVAGVFFFFFGTDPKFVQPSSRQQLAGLKNMLPESDDKARDTRGAVFTYSSASGRLEDLAGSVLVQLSLQRFTGHQSTRAGAMREQ